MFSPHVSRTNEVGDERMNESDKGYVLSIDCGSTNLKAAIFDKGLKRLADAYVPLNYTVNTSEQVEFSADAFLKSAFELMAVTCKQAGISTMQVEKIGISSQAQTFALLGRDGRSAVTPFISWLDRRATAESKEINNKITAHFHSHSSFAPASAGMMASKLLWMKRSRSDFDKCSVCSLPGYLGIHLGAGNVIDDNLAAMSGLYSLAEHDWWKEMMIVCGLQKSQLPAIVAVGGAQTAKYGVSEAAPEFAPDLQVVYAGNDQTAGAFGNFCESHGTVATLGTALVAYRYVGTNAGPYHNKGCWGPYPEGGYYELATISEGCRSLDLAQREIMPGSVKSEVLAAGDAAADLYQRNKETVLASNCLFFPKHVGSSKAWYGDGSTEMKLYAIMEGITFCLKHLISDVLETSQNESGLVLTGGGSKSSIWLQMIADTLSMPVCQGKGDSLLGVARMSCNDAVEMEGMLGLKWQHPTSDGSEVMNRRYEQWVKYSQ